MTDRITCCIPFCRHTRGNRKGQRPIADGNEWICGEHWRLVSTVIKRRRAKLKRYRKRLYPGPKVERLFDIDDRLWEVAKKQAIERAAGI